MPRLHLVYYRIRTYRTQDCRDENRSLGSPAVWRDQAIPPFRIVEEGSSYLDSQLQLLR